MNIDHLYANRLLDCYAVLLTKRQRQVADDYYGNDLSMQEIAENEAISKAAVSDLLKRVQQQLLRYEKLLHLAEKKDLRDKMLREAKECQNIDVQKFAQKLERIEEKEYE